MKTTNEETLYELVKMGEWKIDNLGRIWKIKNGQQVRVERKTPQGYLRVRKMINGIRLHTGAHRLVYRHFFGKIPIGKTINHKDGIKDNNHPSNLEIATYSENMKHAFKMGLKEQWGQVNPASKLTNEEVVAIREIYAQGKATQAEIAKNYNVSHQTISKIVRGDRRKMEKGTTADYTTMRQRSIKRDSEGKFTK